MFCIINRMDILSHALWSSVGARISNKKLGTKIDPWWTGFWGAFPDLISFAPLFFVMAWQVISNANFQNISRHAGIGKLTSSLYPASHSLIIFLGIFLLISLIKRRPAWEMGGWALHIILDIGTHSAEYYPTRFLWPISEIYFGGIRWQTLWFLVVDYVLLGLSFFALRETKGFGSPSLFKKILIGALALIALFTIVSGLMGR